MKKILYSLVLFISLFITTDVVKAINASNEKEVMKFTFTCQDLANFNSGVDIDGNSTDNLVISIKSSGSKYYLIVNGTTVQPREKTSFENYLYDNSDIKLRYCGKNHAYSANSSEVIFDYLYRELDKVVDKDLNLSLVKVDAFENKSDILIVPSESSYMSNGVLKLDDGTEMDISAIDTNKAKKEVIDVNQENSVNCYYNYIDVNVPHPVTLTYDKNTSKFSSITSPYGIGSFKTDFVDTEITSNIRNGVCPQTIRLCDPKSNEMYFSTSCAGSSYDIYTSNSITGSTNPFSSDEYKTKLEDLKTPLSEIPNGLAALNYSLLLDGADISLNKLDYGTGICEKGSCGDSTYYTIEALMSIKKYCNQLNLKKMTTLYDADDIASRREECISFDKFYNKLVADRIISNLASGCGFISTDLGVKLNNILNLVKIAGPILAIILGMIDFTKVLIAGDAEKESKDAWKKFKIRLFAAALLFVIPFIIQIPLNLIMGSGNGYDSDNPFCGIGEE